MGNRIIIGVDEVGRGAWAGPIVACAVVVTDPSMFLRLPVTDSKMLSATTRENMSAQLTACCRYSLGIVSNKIIDRVGIQQANVLAIDLALRPFGTTKAEIHSDYVGGFKNYTVTIRPITFHVQGESVVSEIAAASILAKVYRDAWMSEQDAKYPEFNFSEHKGYGTKTHRKALYQYGATPLHRMSFQFSCS